VEVRPIAAADTRPLRHRVLRPSQPLEATVYPGDDDPDTLHLGAFEGDRLVGIASLYREARGDQAGGWRLRGMATDPAFRGRGAGRALVAASVAHVAAHGGGELWCNARAVARSFYGRAGFDIVGDEFHIDDIGPHFVMRVDVPGDST
jgi:predicted GNAT family N-acyltransferase